MHPSAPDLRKYAADGHPSPIPAPGIPNHGPRETYPSLSMSSMLAHALPVKWSTGLCHCCDDPANSCATSGTWYALVGSYCLACLDWCPFRSKMRAHLEEALDCLVDFCWAHLEEALDCLVDFCCSCCPLCQQYRELENRGSDMGIGREANMDRQRHGITVAPITVAPMIEQGMTR